MYILFLLYPAVNQIASSSDYSSQSLISMVTFANEEVEKFVSVQVLDDNIPEIMEYFTVHLTNPQGGKALINEDKVYSPFHYSLSIHSSIYPFINLFIYLSIHRSIYSSVYLSIQSTFEVAITANDNQGGVFSLVTTSLSLNQDSNSEGTYVHHMIIT